MHSANAASDFATAAVAAPDLDVSIAAICAVVAVAFTATSGAAAFRDPARHHSLATAALAPAALLGAAALDAAALAAANLAANAYDATSLSAYFTATYETTDGAIVIFSKLATTSAGFKPV